MRIAAVTAWRITGSPTRATTRRSTAPSLAARDRRAQPAGQHQRPGRGIDEQRGGLAEMPRPIAARQLVADQLGRRSRGIGNAQQRLGKAHQRDAFVARQRELVEERVDAAFAVARWRRASTSTSVARGLSDPRRGGFTAIGSGDDVRDSSRFRRDDRPRVRLGGARRARTAAMRRPRPCGVPSSPDR